MEFVVHDQTSAPAEVAPALAQAARRYGFVPNLYGVMAESPQTFNAYRAISEQFHASSLPADAQQVVLLTVSRDNGCEYCVAVHSTVAFASGIDRAVVEAIRQDKPIDDPRLEAVRRLAQAVVQRRGWVPDEELEGFLAAGYTRRHVLDVFTGVAMKTLSNYVNHVAHTPLDDAFAAQAWRRD